MVAWFEGHQQGSASCRITGPDQCGVFRMDSPEVRVPALRNDSSRAVRHDGSDHAAGFHRAMSTKGHSCGLVHQLRHLLWVHHASSEWCLGISSTFS